MPVEGVMSITVGRIRPSRPDGRPGVSTVLRAVGDCPMHRRGGVGFLRRLTLRDGRSQWSAPAGAAIASGDRGVVIRVRRGASRRQEISWARDVGSVAAFAASVLGSLRGSARRPP